MEGRYRSYFCRFDNAPHHLGDLVTAQSLIPALESYHQRCEASNRELDCFLLLVRRVTTFALAEGFPTTFTQNNKIFYFQMSAPVWALDYMRHMSIDIYGNRSMLAAQGWVQLPGVVPNAIPDDAIGQSNYDAALLLNQPVVGWTMEQVPKDHEEFIDEYADLFAQTYSSSAPPDTPQDPQFLVMNGAHEFNKKEPQYPSSPRYDKPAQETIIQQALPVSDADFSTPASRQVILRRRTARSSKAPATPDITASSSSPVPSRKRKSRPKKEPTTKRTYTIKTETAGMGDKEEEELVLD